MLENQDDKNVINVLLINELGIMIKNIKRQFERESNKLERFIVKNGDKLSSHGYESRGFLLGKKDGLESSLDVIHKMLENIHNIHNNILTKKE